MTNWEKHQIRIASAKTAGEFIKRFLDMNDIIKQYCFKRILSGNCRSIAHTNCEECLMNWLNDGEDETEGELY